MRAAFEAWRATQKRDPHAVWHEDEQRYTSMTTMQYDWLVWQAATEQYKGIEAKLDYWRDKSKELIKERDELTAQVARMRESLECIHARLVMFDPETPDEDELNDA